MAEGARLESEYTPKAYRGFESPSLRQRCDGKNSLAKSSRFYCAFIKLFAFVALKLGISILQNAHCVVFIFEKIL